MEQSLFTISLLGFDDRAADMLAQAARATMKIVEPISENETQVVVIDVDGSEGVAIWDNFRTQWPHKPAVIVGDEDPGIEDAIFTEKPFTVETLIDNITEAIVLAPADDAEDIPTEITLSESPDATIDNADSSNKNNRGLSEMANELTSNSTASRELPARTLDSPNPDEIFFSPDAHMIGLVLKGISQSQKKGTIAKLACLLDRTIYIDAENKIINSNLKDIHMRQIAIAPLGKGDSGLDSELEMIKSTSIEELASSESSSYPMDAFVWELALLTSKGRVPIGTPLDKPTYLMQWPNFTRLMHSPNDMKIAAYWLRLPSSLIGLSENLNVPINDVNLIYSAAFLTGIAGEATRKSDAMLKPSKPEQHKNRNLFGSIMNKFKK